MLRLARCPFYACSGSWDWERESHMHEYAFCNKNDSHGRNIKRANVEAHGRNDEIVRQKLGFDKRLFFQRMPID